MPMDDPRHAGVTTRAALGRPALSRPPHPSVVILVVLTPVMFLAVFRIPPPTPNSPLAGWKMQSRLDPQVAPWWELTVLPKIGETKARRIVAHRDAAAARGDSVRLFCCAEDLDEVHGIGPKTVRRLAPHLRFDCR